METVMPTSRSTVAANRASTLAALMRCSRAVPARSMKASSIDSGSTCGVNSCISLRTCRLTPAYFSMFGRTMVACGQRRRASNIGMAERTPKMRAI
jgi:hypothetical protein